MAVSRSSKPKDTPKVELSLVEGRDGGMPLKSKRGSKYQQSTPLSKEHRQTLEKAGISETRIGKVTSITEASKLDPGLHRWGDRVLPVMQFLWHTVTGKRIPQIRLNDAITGKDGHEIRYLFPDGISGLIGVDQAFTAYQDDTRIPALFVEGTKQFLATASALEEDNPAAVPFGFPGCWGWSSKQEPCEDLLALVLQNRDVLVAFDADMATNPNVFQAARRLRDYLEGEFLARSVRFLAIPGGTKDGLDDLLGRQTTTKRRKAVLLNLIKRAIELPNKGPRMPSKDSGFFDLYGNLKSKTCWGYLAGEHDLALAGDKSIAVYSGGVYWNSDSLKFRKIIGDTLGNHYKPEHENTLTKLGLAELKAAGLEIPFRQERLVLNFRNGLLDMKTMELQPHTPEHRTLVQWPINWDPEASCPTFDWWLEQVIPGQGEVLMDVASQMLDQTRQPTRLLFLYGPSRSGKSTFLRILQWIAGDNLSSSVSMHQLSNNRFAVARLFGKILNTFADLSADDLKDLSILKSLTGEDTLEVENKCQPLFKLENMAMLAFSANSVPAVAETSLAYFTRVSAFRFDQTFLGKEDPSIEDRIHESEIPGIVRRLVGSLKTRKDRGGFLKADLKIQEDFARQSDRVRLFLSECTRPGDHSSQCIRRSALYQMFCDWLREETDGKGRAMGKQKFFAKLRSAEVVEFKPERGSWCWDLIKFDPETAEPNSLLPEPLLTKKHLNTPDAQGDLPIPGVSSSAVSAVLPHTPPYKNQLEKFPGNPQCVETAETAEPNCPTEELIDPCSDAPLIVDLETQSATKLWDISNRQGQFIRLVGTDHGNNVDPSQLLDHRGALVAHNGWNFDFMALALHHGLPLLELSEQGRLIDTMVLGLTLDPPDNPDMEGSQIANYYSLNNCAKRLGIKGKTDDLANMARTAAKAAGYNGKSKELENIGYGLIAQSDPNYNAYLRGDIEATRAVFDHLVPTGELNAYCRREMKIMGRLTAGISLAGTRLDVGLTRKRYEEIEQKKECLRQILVEKFGLPTTTADGRPAKNPLNCNGASEAIKAAAAEIGLTLPLTPKTGKPSTSKDNLDPLLKKAREAGDERQVSFLETILGLTGARSVYETALNYLQADGRIHPQITPLQASGRFSITKPGITVFGKRGSRVSEREIFLPDSDNHVLLAADLSQIDMRAIAAHAQDPDYLGLFATGRDAHSEVADAVGLSRSDAKAIGHGWNYGMSINGMVRHGIDQGLAEQFDRRMNDSFPQLVRWRELIRLKAERGERLDNGFGRLMKANPDRAYTQAPALMGQGTARDLMMEVVLRLPLHLVSQLRFLVHDELVFSVPQERWKIAEEEIRQAMTFEWAPPRASHMVKVIGELSRPGRNWAECYSQSEDESKTV